MTSIPPTTQAYTAYGRPSARNATSYPTFGFYLPTEPPKPPHNHGFWPKLLMGGLVIGGLSALALRKLSPGTLQKLQQSTESLISTIGTVTPDWAKNMISEAGTKVQNLFKGHSTETPAAWWHKAKTELSVTYKKLFAQKPA